MTVLLSRAGPFVERIRKEGPTASLAYELALNDVGVELPSLSDEALFAGLAGCLDDPRFADVRLSVHAGRVQIKGTVSGRMEMNRVVWHARTLAGTENVDNRLQVAGHARPAAPITPSPITRSKIG